MNDQSFEADVAFLRQHVETLVLQNDDGAALVVVPQYQGRTMTSCCQRDGSSFGFINYAAVASEELSPKINLYGGEDRYWVSPEGGQYSIFFQPGKEMSFANWRTPAELDTLGFELVEHQPTVASFRKDALFTNWSGTVFDVTMEREVELLDRAVAAQQLDDSLDGVRVCAHESRNRLINRGRAAWQPETGLIGIWMLCMSKPSESATLIVPFTPGDSDSADLSDSQIVTADYFGPLNEQRLKIDRERNLIYFLGDGQHRSKLGLGFDRVTSRLGSWDAVRGILSVVEFNLPEQAPNGYNNNLWEMQDQPYAGDVINCYNDGLNESGSSLAEGGFYELETISPALALGPGQGYTHKHRTLRMEGDRDSLSRIAESAFGVDLPTIEAQFGNV